MFAALFRKRHKQQNEPYDTVDYGSLSAGIWLNRPAGRREYRWTVAGLTEVNGKRVLRRGGRPEDVADLLGLAEQLASWFASERRLPHSERTRFDELSKMLGQFLEVQRRMGSNGVARETRTAGPADPTGSRK